MNRVLILLCLMILTGCGTTPKQTTIVQYQDREIKPSASLLTECQRPFDSKPLTYGEAASRDQVWLCAWERCAWRIMTLRKQYGYSVDYQPLCVLESEQTK
ncbi:hypothetical protein MACH09_35000 [Vibrio sp. MACH09]|nr:hypothetical protein MACH09_35000 [Vibrio sp. MACH09]